MGVVLVGSLKMEIILQEYMNIACRIGRHVFLISLTNIGDKAGANAIKLLILCSWRCLGIDVIK